MISHNVLSLSGMYHLPSQMKALMKGMWSIWKTPPSATEINCLPSILNYSAHAASIYFYRMSLSMPLSPQSPLFYRITHQTPLSFVLDKCALQLFCSIIWVSSSFQSLNWGEFLLGAPISFYFNTCSELSSRARSSLQKLA